MEVDLVVAAAAVIVRATDPTPYIANRAPVDRRH